VSIKGDQWGGQASQCICKVSDLHCLGRGGGEEGGNRRWILCDLDLLSAKEGFVHQVGQELLGAVAAAEA